MNRHARAYWITSPGASEIREETLATPRPGEVLVQTLYSAVSRGTESLVFHGKVPKSEHERMRCPHQTGDFPAPVKYGYANVGRVLEGPDELRGRLVFCLYPHQTAYVVPETAVIALPDAVLPERAILGANMETANNALWDARPMLGDRISIVGAGLVGCLCAYLARQTAAADVELIDIREERGKIAEVLGVRFATPRAAKIERDLVIHASATSDGLRTALELAATEATIVELSWFGDNAVTLPLGGPFHAKRLTLRASQVGKLGPNARARWQHRSRLELALALCRDALLDVLIDGESEFDMLPSTMPRLASPASGALCHRLRYS